ncbi:hypothetical protein L5F50_04350, partial [Aliarcobacter butzleri]|nr:hypothetical protein [Aliarcobacter butzleri]
NKALILRRALFLFTAFPTFFEVTNAALSIVLELKKATKLVVCQLLPLLYSLLNSLGLFIL